MERRKIGSLSVTVAGLGCNNFGKRLDEAGTRRVIDAALDAGINFFDTADIYTHGQSEEFIGRALGGRRHDVVIATKFGKPMPDGGKGASAGYVRKAAEASLKRLRTDVIDLYQQHEPDPDIPLDETSEALSRLIEEGKVREVGYSNYDAEQFRRAQQSIHEHDHKAVSLQNEYSLLQREPENEVLAECERQGAAFLPFFPLAAGLLTGKYRRGQPLPESRRITDAWKATWLTDERLDVVENLRAFAERRQLRLVDIAVAWLLSRPVVASVIAGATSPEQVKANVAAAQWQLTSTDLSEIDTITA